MNRIRVAFFGSSTDDYSKDIETLFDCLFAVYDEVIVVNGGYQGTMKAVAEKGKEIAKKLGKEIYVQGVLFDGYKKDPNQSSVNIPNCISDAQISSTSIGGRIQSMIDMVDIVIALPGKTGTLHEIIQTIETIQYGMDYSKEVENFKRLLIHSNWKKSIDNLHQNGNMSQRIYQFLLNNLFSFDSKKDKKKEQIIKKIQSITPIEDERKQENELVLFPIKTFKAEEKQEPLPDSHKLVKVIAEINRVLNGEYFENIKKNKIVGLDVALKEADKETGKLFRLDSVGSNKYLNTLDKFMNKYKSVIENDSRVNKWYQINNIKATTASELFYQDNKNKSSLNGSENGTIQNWIEYLEKESLGKHLYWMSVKHERYHISTYLVLDCLLSENLKNNVEKIVNQFLLEYMLVESAGEYIKIALESSFKAAISQVMARNSSHNIGSHVMNKLTGDLSSLALLDFSKINELNYQSTYEKDLQKLHSEIKKEINDDKDLISLTNEQREKVFKHKILLAQIALFNNYIKCRMDYLADITLGIPAMQISKRLKSDVLKSLDDVRLLLENISGLSGFKYSIDIKCDFDKDPAIAMPNDILGCQAFYNIVENVIRNTAKHSDKKNIDDPNNPNAADKIVHFTVCVKKIDSKNSNSKLDNQSDLLYEVNIFDNIIVEGAAKLDEDDKEEYYRETNISKDANISKIDYLVFSQNKKLNDSILKKEDHTLRSTSLGLIEMEASACYLRKMDIANLESDDYQIDYNDKIENSKGNLNLLKAVAIENKYLGYRFFVLKPTEVLLVGNFQLSADQKNNGFLQLSFEDFQNEIEAGKVFNHQFLVYEDEKTNALINQLQSVKDIYDNEVEVFKYKSLLPKRIMNWTPANFVLRNKAVDEIMKNVWEYWAKQEGFDETDLSTGVPCSDKSTAIHILNHGPSHIEDETQKADFNKWYGEKWSENTNYIEALSSKGQQKLPSFEILSKPSVNNVGKPLEVYLRNVMKFENGKFIYPDLYYSVVESAIAKIVIIDERVQYASKHNIDEEFPYSKHYKRCNIFLPNEKIDLGANDLAKVKTDVETFLKPFLNSENYIVIHYSIIERFFNTSNNKEEDVHKWLNDLSIHTNVIVTSGRGTLKNLPPNIHFINLSPLLASVIDFRSKFYLHQIIMSSRKPN